MRAENERTLNTMGALRPYYVVKHHQFWLPFTCTLLHAGPLHLAMNAFGLYYLGPFVERALGAFRYLTVYLLSSVTGPLIAVALYLYFDGPNQTLVGASGGIMGLVGATAAILLRGWRQEKSRTALRRLSSIGLLIIVQVAFDLSNPQVSFLAHSTGLFAGFLITLPLSPRRVSLTT